MEKKPMYPESGPHLELSKAEIDKKIEQLQQNRSALSDEQNTLSEALNLLLREYGEALGHLSQFKDAGENIEERIANPTLSDNLISKFGSLFLKNYPNIEDKASFLENKEGSKDAKVYRESGGKLRDSVSEIRETKVTLKELMDKDLGFRGGIIEGEEESPRSKSITEIKSKISELEQKISADDENIKILREESFEAWKKENPQEWERLEKERKAKEEIEQKIVLFQEFLTTKPNDSEIVSVFKANRGNELGGIAKTELMKRGANIVGLGIFEGSEEEELYIEKYMSARSFEEMKPIVYSLYQYSPRLQEKVVNKVLDWGYCEMVCPTGSGGHIPLSFYARLPRNLQQKFVDKYNLYRDERTSSGHYDGLKRFIPTPPEWRFHPVAEQFPDLAYKKMELSARIVFLEKVGTITDEETVKMILKDLEEVKNEPSVRNLSIANRYNSTVVSTIAEAIVKDILRKMGTGNYATSEGVRELTEKIDHITRYSSSEVRSLLESTNSYKNILSEFMSVEAKKKSLMDGMK